MPRRLSTAAVLVAAAVLATDGARLAGQGAGAPEGPRRRAPPLRRRLAAASRLFAPLAPLASLALGAAESSDGSHFAEDFFSSLDRNNDGMVDPAEFSFWDSSSRRTHARTMALFVASDIDLSGSLCPKEVDYMRFLSDSEHLDGFYGGRDGFRGEEVEALMDELDTNGDGRIDLREHVESMKDHVDGWGVIPAMADRIDDPILEEWMEDIFRWCDVDGDRYLGPAELHFSEFVIRSEVNWSRRQENLLVDMMLTHLDENGNGRIEEAEVSMGLAKDIDARRQAASDGDPTAWTRESPMSYIGEHFQEVDVNGDGALDPGEIASIADLVDLGGDRVS